MIGEPLLLQWRKRGLLDLRAKVSPILSQLKHPGTQCPVLDDSNKINVLTFALVSAMELYVAYQTEPRTLKAYRARIEIMLNTLGPMKYSDDRGTDPKPFLDLIPEWIAKAKNLPRPPRHQTKIETTRNGAENPPVAVAAKHESVDAPPPKPTSIPVTLRRYALNFIHAELKGKTTSPQANKDIYLLTKVIESGVLENLDVDVKASMRTPPQQEIEDQYVDRVKAVTWQQDKPAFLLRQIRKLRPVYKKTLSGIKKVKKAGSRLRCTAVDIMDEEDDSPCSKELPVRVHLGTTIEMTDDDTQKPRPAPHLQSEPQSQIHVSPLPLKSSQSLSSPSSSSSSFFKRQASSSSTQQMREELRGALFVATYNSNLRVRNRRVNGVPCLDLNNADKMARKLEQQVFDEVLSASDRMSDMSESEQYTFLGNEYVELMQQGDVFVQTLFGYIEMMSK